MLSTLLVRLPDQLPNFPVGQPDFNHCPDWRVGLCVRKCHKWDNRYLVICSKLDEDCFGWEERYDIRYHNTGRSLGADPTGGLACVYLRKWQQKRQNRFPATTCGYTHVCVCLSPWPSTCCFSEILSVVFLVWGTKISDYSYCSFNLQYFQVLAGAIEEETCGHVSLVRYPQINSWIHDLIARHLKAISGWMDWTGSYLES